MILNNKCLLNVMMMTIDSFNSLDETKKTEAILKATFLADRLTRRHYVKLYSIEKFYAEVYFDDHSHLITLIRAFGSTSAIMPYLETLKIAV